jgi:ubiquinone/menaquinone biosynthesis C-methylase UbiE
MSESKSPDGPVTPERIFQLAWGFAPTLMIHAAIENRIFDSLDAGPKNIDELAAATSCSKRGLRAVANSFVGFGLILRKGDRYTLAPDAATFLVSTKPAFLGGMIEHLSKQLLDNFRHLPEIIRTGKPASAVNTQNQGAEFFSKFVECLFNLNYAPACALGEELAKHLPTGKINILDIAAGSGVWGIGVAQRFPQSQITAVDWATVLPVTRRVAARHKLADRLKTIEGDIHDVDFGKGFNVATLGHILHSEGEKRSRHLLKKVYDALVPGGIIAIAEFVPNDDRTGPPYPLLFAVNMLVHTDDGDTYTFKQMTSWLEEIGFRQARQVELPHPSPILVAVKPK